MRTLHIAISLLGLTSILGAQSALAQDTFSLTITSPDSSETNVISKDACTSNQEYDISWQVQLTSGFGLTSTRYDYTYYASDSSGFDETLSRRLGSNDVTGSESGEFTLNELTTMVGPYTVRVGAKAILGVDNCDDAPSAATKYVLVKVQKSGSSDEEDREVAFVEFTYDADGPAAPEITAASPGDNNIKLSWTKSPDEGISRYEVLYFTYDSSKASDKNPLVTQRPCNDYVASATGTISEELEKMFSGKVTEAEFEEMTTELQSYDINDNELEDVGYISIAVSSGEKEITIQDGLSNGVCTLVAMRAVGTGDIKGGLSNTAAVAPIPVLTFADRDAKLGGQEQGGYCFIATAAHGSYAHPTVLVLRAFRDHVLKRTVLGTALVSAYYRWSPGYASLLAQSPQARAWTQVLLLPVALLGLFFVLAPLLGLGLITRLVWRNRRRMSLASGQTLGFVLALILAGQSIEAQAHEVIRGEGPRFAISFKGGPYLPAMYDSQAFREVFGEQEPITDTTALPAEAKATANVESVSAYSLGVDLILFDAFGEAGVGSSFGFYQFVGRGLLTESGVDEAFRSGDTTVFNILPLTAEVFYRLTYFNDEFGIPLSPYVRGGFAYYLWWNTNDNGDTDLFFPENGTDSVKAEGAKYGYHASVGLALELNVIEPNSAQKLHQTTGISSSSIFVEYEKSSVNNFGSDGYDFSNVDGTDSDGEATFNQWRVGLYLEF